MPINIQHAVMFTLVFIIVVSLLSITVYTVTMNMLADTYRYEKMLEKANEKVKVVAIATSNKMYYGVRNLGLTRLVIKEMGVVDSSGNLRVLTTGVAIDPGEAYINEHSKMSGVLYVITERGNIFATPIAEVESDTGVAGGVARVQIKSLLPSVYYAPSPIVYNDRDAFVVSLSTTGYIFGFLYVNDPHSDDQVIITLGPYSVADIFKKARTAGFPYVSEQKNGHDGNVLGSAQLHFDVVDDKKYWKEPYYLLTMSISAQRTDWLGKGLVVRGCFGYIWRTMTNSMYGLKVVTSTPSGCKCRESEPYCVCDENHVVLIPSVEPVESLMPTLAYFLINMPPVEAPVGAQAYIVFAKCFRVEADDIRSIHDVHDPKIYTSLPFPGNVESGIVGSIRVPAIEVELKLNPKILLETMLGVIT